MKSQIARSVVQKKRRILNVPINCERKNFFGEALKELRLEKGLTQEKAADLLGVTQAQWSSYELGKSRPDLDTIILIAKGLEISPLSLLGRSLDKSKYFDSSYQLSFEEYESMAKNVETYRKRKLIRKVKALS